MPVHEHLGYANPVVDTDFPDPGVFYDAPSSTWYAYGTNGNGKNIQVATSKDFCSWQLHDHDALPPPYPQWTGKPGFFWAPEVVTAPGNRGGYLMYVSCADSKTDKQAIGVAYSEKSPMGPFHFVSNGPIVSRGETGGCIDPCPFIDPPTGRRFLVYKNDYKHMRGEGPQIWLQELSEDGLTFSSDRYPLLSPTQPWQTGLIEAPHLVYHAPSKSYVCFFSSGTFTEADYSTGYAISRQGPLGPYETAKWPLLRTDIGRGIVGPGGQCVVQGVEGNYFVVFHSHNEPGCKGGRRMCVHRVEFGPDGTPSLPGKPVMRRRLRLGAEDQDGISDAEAKQRSAGHHQGGQGQKPFNADQAKSGAKKIFNSLKKAF